MEVFTLNRKFLQQDVIDTFHSIIWTERYYGDSEVELTVPLTMESIKKLPAGTFLGVSGSDEVMILESMVIEDEKIKFTGMGILPWLNNRFLRSSTNHKETEYAMQTGVPGWLLWELVRLTCHSSSQWLQGTIPIGIPNPGILIIPGLELKDYDKSGDPISISAPYGPVYDALRGIATTYKIGMQITLESANESSYVLGFRSYKGVDRTSSQTVRPPVRFSPQMDSLANIKEVRSVAALKTRVYAYAPNVTVPAPTVPGEAVLADAQYTGFDLRALMIFVNDLSNDTFSAPGPPDTATDLLNLLNGKARESLSENSVVKAVDGEIVPTNQYQYGRDYNLGDIIEVQGNSDVISTSRVTEHIRSQDEAGERSYPTVAMLD